MFDFMTNHLIESMLLLLAGVPGTWAVMKHKSGNQEAKMDNLSSEMGEIKNTLQDIRIENAITSERTLNTQEQLKEIKEQIKDIKRPI